MALFSLSTLLALAVVGYIVHCFTQHARLCQFKGPRTVGFSKLWLLKVMRSGTMHHYFTEANKKYGTLMALFLSSSVAVYESAPYMLTSC